MTRLTLEDVSVSSSVATFAVRLRSIFDQEEVFFLIPKSGMPYRVESLDPIGRGLSMQLRGYGPFSIDFESIEAESFSCGDSQVQSIIPCWMIA